MKVCFTASSGGHWEELQCLREVMQKVDAIFITEEGGQVQDSQLGNLYTVPQINRHERCFVLHFLQLFYKIYKIVREEKPDVVISTGALITFPACLIAKLFGKKVVYIESFARVDGKSLTGRLVYPFADLFLVQWESMLKHYPKAQFVGGIF